MEDRQATHKHWSRYDLIQAAGLMVLLLLVYYPALQAGFIWDDDDHFTRNPLMTAHGGLKDIWTSSLAIYYPATLTVWWAMRRLFDLNPFPYHLVTLLFHAANALLLRTFFERMRWPGGWWAAALFALHPVQVESVAWATELKNTLSGFFFLLTAIVYTSFDARREQNLPGAWPRWLLALALFKLALASKPSTVMLPPVLVLILWWQNGRFPSVRRLWPLAPLFALSLASSLYTIWEQKHHSNAKGPEWDFTLAERLMLAPRTVAFYIGKLVWPHPLIFIYPRWVPGRPDALLAVGVAGLALAGGVLWWFRQRPWARATALAAGCYLLLLFPVMGFFNIYFMRFSFVADHFQYLASMAALGLVSAALSAASDRWPSRADMIVGIRTAVLMAWCGLAWKQCHLYRDEWTLWRGTIALNPSAAIAHGNLGHMLLEEGKLHEAEKHLETAVELSEYYWEANNDLGRLRNLQGRPEDAEKLFRRTIAIRDNYPIAWDNLATTLAQLGRTGEAIEAFDRAVALNPTDAVTRCNYAAILLRANRPEEARLQVEIAARLEPNDERIIAFRDSLRRLGGT